MAESTKALKIELRAFKDDSGLTTRKLKLLPDSSLLIARSSRSNSKQLIAAADNLVLDSPIVSREHARLTTDSDCTTLFIEDLGSMHGTRVNYVQLGKHVAYQLKCGDKLQIGNEVIRGEESFSPPRFDISFERTETSPYSRPTSRKFTVPEYDSDEDDNSHNEESDREDGGQDSRSSLLDESLHAAISAVEPEPLKRLGSQQNPVQIVDDTEVVHDSILIVDDDDEVRAEPHRSSNAVSDQAEHGTTGVARRRPPFLNLTTSPTAGEFSTVPLVTPNLDLNHLTPLTPRTYALSPKYTPVSPSSPVECTRVSPIQDYMYDSESGETDFHPEVDQNDLDEETSQTSSDPGRLEDLLSSSLRDTPAAEDDVLDGLEDDSLFDTDDEDAIAAAETEAACQKQDGANTEQMPPRLKVSNVADSYKDQPSEELGTMDSWTGMPFSPISNRVTEQAPMNRSFGMPSQTPAQAYPYYSSSGSRVCGLSRNPPALHPDTFTFQSPNRTNYGVYQPQPLPGPASNTYNTWNTHTFLPRYENGPFAHAAPLPTPLLGFAHTHANPRFPPGPEISHPKPSKVKTGFSIQEIVDSASSVEAGPVAGTKRKADELVGEESAASVPSNSITTAAERPMSTQPEQSAPAMETVSDIKDATVPVAALPTTNAVPSEVAVVEERPAKRSRLGYAATAVAGAVVGSIGMFAALALSPEL
ncbi:hypothetical protein H2201_008033 [Coniosporium apollinis]|uniref:FHA domain-containing protein n=1 Tax=Coniosporium apollinis TaxID=61459 RepID=A0ABQ9NH85_9PEZI|nr:hypothetical protein H2201_008033 [Coniosporium apollinis]